MDNSKFAPLFHNYAEAVINRLRASDALPAFQEYSQLISDRIADIQTWQIALPVISCLAVGGMLEDGFAVASAWCPIYLASEILDDVEDKELIPDRYLASPEVATNLATSLIFGAFHALTFLQDSAGIRRATRIFSGLGFEATYGQHRDLLKTPSSVENALHNYWETIILKAGSVFRMATAGGAAAGTSDDALLDTFGDYGTALGVMLQLMDDCRDAFNQSQGTITWEISLPLLLHLMATGEEYVVFPKVSSKMEWRALLEGEEVIHAISAILLEWKTRALESLAALRPSQEKLILESIPSLFLTPALRPKEVHNEYSA